LGSPAPATKALELRRDPEMVLMAVRQAALVFRADGDPGGGSAGVF